MKTFQEFILECELVEGKVEWDNPDRPLQSGWTPREKNRAKRIHIRVEDPNRIPSERDLERYGKLKLAHDEQKGQKVPKNKLHQFKKGYYSTDLVFGGKSTLGQSRRRNDRNPETREDQKKLKEPKESYDYSIDEGRIPWDDTNRPLRSGWTPREKNRAKRISLGVENPEHKPKEKDLERYGRLKGAQDTMKNVRLKAKYRHKNPEDYSIGRRNVFWTPDRKMPSHNIHGEGELGLIRQPRNYSQGEDVFKRKFGAKNDEKRDKYYEKGPKGLKEPK